MLLYFLGLFKYIYIYTPNAPFLLNLAIFHLSCMEHLGILASYMGIISNFHKPLFRDPVFEAPLYGSDSYILDYSLLETFKTQNLFTILAQIPTVPDLQVLYGKSQTRYIFKCPRLPNTL